MGTPDPWKPVHALIGKLLEGRYLVASFIREGGMAQVFCGVQEAEPRHVAIKVMHPDLAGDPEVVGRFLREAQLVSRLQHPNIVRTLAVGEEEDLLYIVMELVFGDDLAEPIKMGSYFSEARAAEIGIDIANALGHAHERGIVHRDIKPENVMLSRRHGATNEDDPEVVKVLDFGVAKLFDDKRDAPLSGDEGVTSARSALTRVGAMIGTPAYMSPEQGRADVIDTRTDIYSLGVLLYEMVTGELPFQGETALQIISRHVNDRPRPPREIRPLHPGLERTILKALAKYPGERHQNASELADELATLLPELSRIVGVTNAPVAAWMGESASRGPIPTPWSAASAAMRVRALAESATLPSAQNPPPSRGDGPASVVTSVAKAPAPRHEPDDAPTLRRDPSAVMGLVAAATGRPATGPAPFEPPHRPPTGPAPFEPPHRPPTGPAPFEPPRRPPTGPAPFEPPHRPPTGPAPFGAVRPPTGSSPVGVTAPQEAAPPPRPSPPAPFASGAASTFPPSPPAPPDARPRVASVAPPSSAAIAREEAPSAGLAPPPSVAQPAPAGGETAQLAQMVKVLTGLVAICLAGIAILVALLLTR